ncbi:hypothetical protein DSO57_1028733 [Entomophthora muscae]|uniref:Uncharacterized protein n=1 Tax=Entomophthora muscae TaxID=34485 RepID=A0ACC2ULV3_9FUNG|nr:hypothetical protein DSO57_1028733 [Entomophthora muscae]
MLNQLATLANSTAIFQCLLGNGIPSARVVQPNYSTYAALNFQWISRKPLKPLAYLRASAATHIQAAIRCSSETGVPIVARAGGHSFEKYSIISNSHVVIDLGEMNSTSLDKETGIVTLGPGLLMGHVNHWLWQQGNYSIPSPRCQMIGLAGFALGGGYGYSSRKDGMLCDRIVEMQMVDASGEILVVNANSHPDLFFALRGAGGGNFGIVTQFRIQTIRPPSIVHSITLKYPFSQLDTILPMWHQWALSNPHRSITAFIFANMGSVTLTAAIQHYDSAEGLKLAQALTSSFPEPLNQTPILQSSYMDMLLDLRSPPNTPTNFKTITRQSMDASHYKTKSILATNHSSNLNQLLANLPTCADLMIDLHGGKINDIATNATAYPHRQNVLYSVSTSIHALTPQQLQEGTQWLSQLTPILSTMGFHVYSNFMDSDITQPLLRFYDNNTKRLVQIKAAYDPANLFNYPHSIPTSLDNL